MNKIQEIKKPKFDNRDFYGGQLDNGIKFSIVNDSHLEKSFVTVCLKVGSFSDPIGYEGLAHFLEHMLFMGSKKYPNENHYNTRLNELGGYSNAYTDVMETVYYFNVYDNGLEEIFDIFSRFFIDPLFDPDSVSREINAVNSEHKKNINQDIWRKYQLILNLTDKASLVNTFVTGSLNSLQKPDLRDQMINFYKKYYTTDNISISIGSSKPIEHIQQIITNTFGHIPKSTESNNHFSITKPFITENIHKVFHLKSVSNIYEVSYLWEIPYQKEFILSKDFQILDMMINNKSDRSIYFHLKNKGYLISMFVETRYEGIFILKLKLTKEGFANLDWVESVLEKGIGQILNSDLETFAKYYQKVMEINFDCVNKFNSEDLCNLLAVNHHYHTTPDIFKGSFTIDQIRTSAEYKDLFSSYIKPTPTMKIISSQSIGLDNLTYIKLPEYDAEYAEIPNNINHIEIPESLCCFDPTNEYFDMKTQLVENLDLYDIPTLYDDRQWYGGCSKFGEPQVRILLQFNSNKLFNSARNHILTNISCSILNYMSTIILYKPLELCYSIVFEPKPTTSSINLKLTGLNDVTKLKLLVEDVSDFLTNTNILFDKISKTYIDNLIVSFKESYQNVKYLNPWEYSSYLIKKNHISTEYTSEDMIREISTLNFDTIKDYIGKLIEGSALTSFVYGDVESIQIKNLFGEKFSKLFNNPSYSLPKINSLTDITINHPNSDEKSNCITLYYPVGKFIPKEFNLLGLAINILSQPFFDELRTKNQLGYLVRMGQTNVRDEHYIIQKIQSEKPIEIVEEKINTFNKNITKILESADFDKFMETLKAQLKESDYSLDEKFLRYYPEISLRQYLFNRNDILLENLDKVTKEDLIKFVKKFINSENKIKIIVSGN